MAWPPPWRGTVWPSWALRDRLPGSFADARFVDAGGLMSGGPAPDPKTLRHVFEVVDRLLRGAQVVQIPVVRPPQAPPVQRSLPAPFRPARAPAA